MTAIFSECGNFRYLLYRQVSTPQTRTAMFIGVNPSDANEIDNDASVRKIIGFCKIFDISDFVLANAFAKVSTDVNGLKTCGDPVGPENYTYLFKALLACDIVIPCWGNRAKLPKDLRDQLAFTLSKIKLFGKPVYSLGFTASGDPKHPLFLPYSTKLERWEL